MKVMSKVGNNTPLNPPLPESIRDRHEGKQDCLRQPLWNATKWPPTHRGFHEGRGGSSIL